jgi:hypothetical protein
LIEYNTFRALSVDDRWRGRVLDLLISEQDWSVEAILVGRGSSFFLRRYLIHANELREIDIRNRSLRLRITERELERHRLESSDTPNSMRVDFDMQARRWHRSPPELELRSMRALFGAEAWVSENKSAGLFEDALFNTRTLKIDAVIVYPAGWWPYQRSYRVDPHKIAELDFAKHRVRFNTTQDELRSQPDFVPDEPVNEVRTGTFDYYGRPSSTEIEGFAMNPQGWPH